MCERRSPPAGEGEAIPLASLVTARHSRAAMPEQPAVALDILYPSGFYSYQTPVMLDYVAAINGIAPPVANGMPFTYLDLGCGDGFTIILLAAIYPQCRFIGVDFNPGHVAVGSALAKAGGIDNVTFVEGPFEAWR